MLGSLQQVRQSFRVAGEEIIDCDNRRALRQQRIALMETEDNALPITKGRLR